MHISCIGILFPTCLLHSIVFICLHVFMQMFCCASSNPCCLKSTSKATCEKAHNSHCPDCALHSDVKLTAEESNTVIGDEHTATRLQKAHSRRFLQSWAQQHRLKNYKRLKLTDLCQNLAKALSGDDSVRSKEKSDRRTPSTKRRSKRRKTTAVATPKEGNARKVPAGHRSCICGTDECKQAMYHYFDEIHDYTWPDKYFPWLYVSIPSLPRLSLKTSTRGARARESEAVTVT